MVADKYIAKPKPIDLTFSVDREVLFALHKNKDLFVDEIKKVLALKYFQSQQLSLGLASRLAGMNKDDFIQLLGDNQIDIYQYTEREFDEEMEFLPNMDENS